MSSPISKKFNDLESLTELSNKLNTAKIVVDKKSGKRYVEFTGEKDSVSINQVVRKMREITEFQELNKKGPLPTNEKRMGKAICNTIRDLKRTSNAEIDSLSTLASIKHHVRAFFGNIGRNVKGEKNLQEYENKHFKIAEDTSKRAAHREKPGDHSSAHGLASDITVGSHRNTGKDTRKSSTSGGVADSTVTEEPELTDDQKTVLYYQTLRNRANTQDDGETSADADVKPADISPAPKPLKPAQTVSLKTSFQPSLLVNANDETKRAIKYALANNKDKLESLVYSAKNKIIQTDEHGNNLLHEILSSPKLTEEHLPLLKYLIKEMPDLTTTRNHEGLNPLMLAATKNVPWTTIRELWDPKKHNAQIPYNDIKALQAEDKKKDIRFHQTTYTALERAMGTGYFSNRNEPKTTAASPASPQPQAATPPPSSEPQVKMKPTGENKMPPRSLREEIDESREI